MTHHTHSPPPSLEAKLVVLGSQNVGKTTLVHRYVQNAFIPPSKAQSTVGASFLTTRVSDPETNTTIRLQIWDTAGQERFRSLSRLYYRGANAAILCYDVTSRRSFEEMGSWLRELRENCNGGDGVGWGDMILHVVGTKSDVVAEKPALREVPFEMCIGYVAEQLYPSAAAAAVTPMGVGLGLGSPQSNRSSGFWGQEQIWDCCHEISAKDGEGIDEVFRVITRKLVEQHALRQEKVKLMEDAMLKTPMSERVDGYFDLLPGGGNGSFRLGPGDKRRSWLGGIVTPGGLTSYGVDGGEVEDEVKRGVERGRCC
ncbi:hypothetical protein M409DRAFT_24074 [Zasmidium cellare ATCC 36951]|uniref:Ras-domain-containing protein n=1 Tax=Zasmidium cellare ATCC 36951 TaxID=1080233 RepID=A0A6A6CHX5_ZASCE|nr:uncharacterized protein M409DRAFT_24074 [Zasmidium cellare ATCC 36951]KAF2165788.1 hypothetical protein M409DRAFT_24074 [Zasmidium cellare ATCC 36951]